MKIRTALIVTALLTGLAAGTGAVAQDTGTDFSGLSNEELTQLRGQVRSMSEEDQVRFRTEMQSRAQTMTPEEREAAGFGPANAPGRQGESGQGQQIQKRDGTGDQDRSMQRQRDGTGYGGGYQSRPRKGKGGGR